MSDTPSVLVCVRVDDLARPTVPSDRAVCGSCLAVVWKSRGGWWWVGPIRCIQCALTEGADDDDAEVVPAPWVRDDLVDHRLIHRVGHSLAPKRPTN